MLEDHKVGQQLLGRINQLITEESKGNPSLGTANLLVIPRDSAGTGGLSSARMQAATGTDPLPNASGSSSRSPVHDANHGGGS